MVTKLLFLLVIVAAVFYVYYHKFTRKPIRIRFDRSRKQGWASHNGWLFLLTVAVLLSCTAGEPREAVMCYDIAEVPDRKPLENLKLAWLTLNTYDGMDWKKKEAGMNEAVDSFNKVIKEYVAEGTVAEDVAQRLVLLHSELAKHVYRQNSGMTCYKMSLLGSMQARSRTELLKQLSLLRQASQKGALTQEVYDKSREAIQKQVEQLTVLDQINDKTPEERQKTLEQIKADKIEVQQPSVNTALFIFQLEQLTPQKPVESDQTGQNPDKLETDN